MALFKIFLGSREGSAFDPAIDCALGASSKSKRCDVIFVQEASDKHMPAPYETRLPGQRKAASRSCYIPTLRDVAIPTLLQAVEKRAPTVSDLIQARHLEDDERDSLIRKLASGGASDDMCPVTFHEDPGEAQDLDDIQRRVSQSVCTVTFHADPEAGAEPRAKGILKRALLAFKKVLLCGKAG